MVKKTYSKTGRVCRSLLDGERWENDEAADGYRSNSFGSEDCVVNV